MITGLNLFHFVALTPTNLNEVAGAKEIAAFVAPESIASPVAGYTLIVALVSFKISVSNPAAQSGSLIP